MYTEEKGIQVLLEAHLLEEVSETCSRYAGCFPVEKVTSRFDPSMGFKHDQYIRYHVRRLSRGALLRLYSTRRNCKTAEIISVCYQLGIALPRNDECAEFWSIRRMMPSPRDCPVFLEMSAALKAHLKKMFKAHALHVYDLTTRKLERAASRCHENGAFNRVPCVLVYRGVASVFHLHNVVIGQDTYVYALPRLQVPTSFEAPTSSKYLLVSGVLVPGGDFKRSEADAGTDLPTLLREHLLGYEMMDDARVNDYSRSLSFAKRRIFEMDDWEPVLASPRLLMDLKPYFKVLKPK